MTMIEEQYTEYVVKGWLIEEMRSEKEHQADSPPDAPQLVLVGLGTPVSEKTL